MPPAAPSTVRAGVLTLNEVTKRYGAGPAAVDALSFTVPAGKVCVLIGPSGCGKTTALRMVNRLVEPTSGSVLLDDVDVRTRKPALLRREIGYVIQQVGLLPHLTIAANVGAVPRLLGWDRERIDARVRQLLTLVGLAPDTYGRRYPGELSGGQQQRVGLARALAGDPPLMLMDEPFSAVDPITRERLQNDFLLLHRAEPKTVLFVSHDIDEAVKMADLIAVMRDGALVQIAPPAELLANPADAFVADFVGADRALKGLALTRLEDIDLRPAPVVEVGAEREAIERRIAAGDLVPVDGALLAVDARGRPLRWVALESVGSRLDATPGRLEPVLPAVATLRDALAALFETGAGFGVVVDRFRRPIGLVGVDAIAGGLSTPAEQAAGADG